MLKHFLQYVLFGFTMFAAGPPAVGGNSDSTSAPAPAGEAAPTGTPQPNSGGNDRGTGQPPDQGLKQLREAYEGVKAKFEPYEKLNLKPDQIQQYSGIYQKVYTEAQSVGRDLGYSDEEIAEALAEDPVRTIDFLRTKAAQSQQNPEQTDLRAQMEEMAQEVLGPIQQRENVRMTDAANQLFEQTTRQLAVESFKAEGVDLAHIPADEMDFLMTATSEILKYDGEALKALKYEGKTTAVQKAFQEARTALDKYYLARSGREKARLQPARPGQPAPQPSNGGKKPTLDQMIENPELINAKYT